MLHPEYLRYQTEKMKEIISLHRKKRNIFPSISASHKMFKLVVQLRKNHTIHETINDMRRLHNDLQTQLDYHYMVKHNILLKRFREAIN